MTTVHTKTAHVIEKAIERKDVSQVEKDSLIKEIDVKMKPFHYKKKTAKLYSLELFPLNELQYGSSKITVHPDDSDWLLADPAAGNWKCWGASMASRAEQSTAHNSRVSKIWYMPIDNASPTDWSTINTTVEVFLDEANSMGKSMALVSFDYQLFVKALDLEIIVAKPHPIILRLDGFHQAKAFLIAISKIMRGSGLDTAIKIVFDAESGVDKVLKASDYYKGVRAHQLIAKAIVLSTPESFKDGVTTAHLDDIAKMGRTPKLWALYLKMVT